MVRKTLLVGASVLFLMTMLFGKDAVSYVSTSCRWARQTVKESVPIDFEIARARNMIKELDPEIRSNMHLIAKEEVDVSRLREQVATTQKALSKDRQDISRLKSDLDQGGSVFVYAGQNYTQKQVESDLTRRFERFKTKEATADKLQKILLAREASLVAASEKLKAMQGAKRQLEVDVENMKARLEMVKVAESTSSFNFDDSKLARTRDALNDISARIDVAEKFVHSNAGVVDQIPLDGGDSRNITEEVAKYFADHPTNDNLVKLD